MMPIDALDTTVTDRTNPPAIEVPNGEETVLSMNLLRPDTPKVSVSMSRYSENNQSNLPDVEDRTQGNITRLDDLIEYFREPRHQLEDEIRKRAVIDKESRAKFRVRLKNLQGEAGREGIEINLGSRRDFVRFISSVAFLKPGSLALLDNGNLKATWRAGVGERLTLEFRGGGHAHYVIFKHRDPGQRVARHSGSDILNDIERQIRAIDVTDLFSA